MFQRLTLLTSLFALGVIMLGAFVRLSDAGLGCPDWPGCYGHMAVPQAEHAVATAQQAFPERPLEAPKAWKEMVHRYFAGTLGLLILAIAALAVKRRRRPGQAVALPLFLVGLVAFQALLGMWTVTLLLKPLVVTGHLLGGMTTVALLWWLTLRHSHYFRAPQMDIPIQLRPWALLGLVLLALQISLGGWVSTNYAALACPELPTCQLQWWPETDFADAFVLWRGLGINYEYGVLDSAARTAIHLTHRLGALMVFFYLGGLAIAAWNKGRGAVRTAAVLLGVMLLVQISLGLSNVYFHLPLGVAVAHNGGAALLLIMLLNLLHVLNPKH